MLLGILLRSFAFEIDETLYHDQNPSSVLIRHEFFRLVMDDGRTTINVTVNVERTQRLRTYMNFHEN
jgi:hypothetical protein